MKNLETPAVRLDFDDFIHPPQGCKADAQQALRRLAEAAITKRPRSLSPDLR